MIADFAHQLLLTIRDVLPIVLILGFFQLVALRRKIPNLGRVLAGVGHVIVGLALFQMGLELALFELGESMALQLTDPDFLGAARDAATNAVVVHWRDYGWVYVFSAAIGFSTTIAEPALIAVGLKAQEVSGGALGAFGLRIAVAVGVAIGVALGTLRIVLGFPLYVLIIIGYVIVIVQTLFAPRTIIPLAYDSGGVTTSTVTVPLITALGLGLAETVPGRSPLLDGFGLIALASVFPIISVMAYAQIGAVRAHVRRRTTRRAPADTGPARPAKERP